jgi:predicted metal-dependent phosphoesterase TrpH
MFYDLHIHTTVSDGTLSPEQAVDFAINQGLAGIAITDHDTVGGIDLARRYIELNSFSFTFIPGVELNTEKNGMEIHILGYFVDPHYSLLEEKLRNIREARLVRGQQMVDKLINMGFKITLEQVKELASGGVIGRPHIAMALKRNGYVNSITEAFDRYLGKGRPAYVPRYKFV